MNGMMTMMNGMMTVTMMNGATMMAMAKKRRTIATQLL